MAKITKNIRPIVSDNVSSAAGQVLTDALDSGFEIDDIVTERGPKIRGEEQFSQEGLDEIVELSSQGAAIPGQSLTNSPDQPYPWEKPATFANPREALNEITNLLLQPEAMKNIVSALVNGAAVADLSIAVLYAKFFEGEINADTMLLLVEPVMYLMMAIGEEGNIQYNIEGGDLDELEADDADDTEEKINEFRNVFSKIKEGKSQDIEPNKINTNALPQNILDRVKEKSPEIKGLLSREEN